jgi:hypothetical protein
MGRRTRYRNRRRDNTRQRAWATAVLGVVCSSLIAWLALDHKPKQTRQVAQDAPASVALLRSTLLAVDAAILPTARAAQVDALRPEIPLLQPALLWVLNQPEHELFAAAAALAADLQIEDAVAPLARSGWQGTGRARRPALQALDRLQPLSGGDLEDLLTSDEFTLELAALDILRTRQATDEELLPFVLELLASPDEPVRQDAFATLPSDLPPATIEVVLDLLADAIATSYAEQLLMRLQPAPAVLEELLTLLEYGSPDRAARILAALDRYATDEAVQQELWAIVDGERTTQLRIAALQCLARANAVSQLPQRAPYWPPMLQYHAASLHAHAADPESLDLLLELIQQMDETADDETSEAAGRARLLLGRVAALPPHSEVARFEAFCSEVARRGVAPDRLAAPGR